MMCRYRSIARSRRRGVSDNNIACTRKRGVVYETSQGYVPAVQTEVSFSLVLVKSFTGLA